MAALHICFDMHVRQQICVSPEVSLRSLGQKVFFSARSSSGPRKRRPDGRRACTKFYKSGQQSMRVAVYGEKGWPPNQCLAVLQICHTWLTEVHHLASHA